MRLLLSIIAVGLLGLSPSVRLAAGQPDCPEKTVKSGLIDTGVYQGIECYELCYASIKLDGGIAWTFLCDEACGEKFFGQPGNHVEVVYDLIQYWNPYDDICLRDAGVVVGGRILKNAEAPRTE